MLSGATWYRAEGSNPVVFAHLEFVILPLYIFLLIYLSVTYPFGLISDAIFFMNEALLVLCLIVTCGIPLRCK